MRIAVSGTHRTGKSTLVAALGDSLPGYRTVAEPYELLAERGYDAADPPDVDDFVIQLKQSLTTLRRPSPNLILDRCPLDFLGYIAASPGGDRFDPEAWRAPLERAMHSLDLVVFLPADPAYDPPGLVDGEDAAFRLAVDAELRDIVGSDSLDLCDGVDTLTLDGPWERRVEVVSRGVEESSGQTARRQDGKTA
jgi:hypothetical protein